MEKFDAVVLANGEYPSAGVPLRILDEADYVACCDGAANTLIARGRTPDIIVGDGDSLSAENRTRYGHLLHHIAEQESNDLTKTVMLLAGRGMRRIAIVGATGKREDHTLGNISLLVEYMRSGLDVRMFTDYGVFIPCCGTVEIPSRAGGQLSIFNFGARALRAEGLRYPIRDFTSWWQGTLNECTGERVIIGAEGEYLVYMDW